MTMHSPSFAPCDPHPAGQAGAHPAQRSEAITDDAGDSPTVVRVTDQDDPGAGELDRGRRARQDGRG